MLIITSVQIENNILKVYCRNAEVAILCCSCMVIMYRSTVRRNMMLKNKSSDFWMITTQKNG